MPTSKEFTVITISFSFASVDYDRTRLDVVVLGNLTRLKLKGHRFAIVVANQLDEATLLISVRSIKSSPKACQTFADSRCISGVVFADPGPFAMGQTGRPGLFSLLERPGVQPGALEIGTVSTVISTDV